VDRESQVQHSVLYASAHPLLNTYSIKHRYDSRSMRGFAGSFSDDLRKELESSDTVKYVGTFSLSLLALVLQLTIVLQRPTERSRPSERPTRALNAIHAYDATIASSKQSSQSPL
jgi:hypothetical protein